MNINTASPQHIVIAAAFALLFLNGCSSANKTETTANADSVVTVTLSTPVANSTQFIQISGNVEAAQTVNISTRVMGYITRLTVKAGDHVRKGQLLATIGNQDILAKRAQADAMIADADAAFKNAQKDQERFNNLYKQQSATAKELENSNLQFIAAKSRLEAARQLRNEATATLNYTTLTAPFAGIIAQKLADAGSMANPGMPILTLEQSGSYQISAAVPENTISQIIVGELAQVNIGAVNKTIKGRVSQIVPSSQFSGGQYLIKITIPQQQTQGLLTGMYANVAIGSKQSGGPQAGNQVLVPISIIEHQGDLAGLYTIGTNHTALLRWVRLGKTEGNQVEVLSGLAPNEQFIINANGRLFNGAQVKIK